MRWLIAVVVCAIGCTSPANPGIATRVELDAGAGAALDMVVIGDDTISIEPNQIDLAGMPGMQTSRGFTINGTGGSISLASMRFIGDTSSTFVTDPPPCASNGMACTFFPQPTLPFDGVVECTPSATPKSATLEVTSNTGAIGTAVVTCATLASNPSFTIPNTVGPVTAAVGSMDTAALRVTNNGDQPLVITVVLDPQDVDSPEWTVQMCTTTPCPLPLNGFIDIPIDLHPSRHGSLDTNITVSDPMAGSQTATLVGTGLGGFLRVDQPATFDHDFGTIAKGQMVTFGVQMTNIGNQDITVTPSDPGAPFGVSTTQAITLGGNAGTGTFDITCFSQTPLAATQRTIDLALSMNTYDKNTDTITVHCAVADTTVQVTNPLDFGELRVGDPPGVLEVEITNPLDGGGNVSITRIELVGEPAALTIDPFSPPQTIADGAQLSTQLHLATDGDVVLDNVRLQIDVNEGTTVTLDLPVTGKVGTPAAVVLPMELALGEVCIGTPVASEVTMTNTGTATLHMEPPTMTSTSFVALFTSPTDYPAPLLPTDKAMVGVMAASAAAGELAGTLEWPVDVPAGKFSIPITLELLAEGTAVSPARLAFGTAKLAEPPPAQQTITIENCGPEPATIRYDRVDARTGPATAWTLDPPDQQRTLLAGEQARIRVGFTPRQPGPHTAVLRIDVDGTEHVVELTGDAIGMVDPEETSFYACGCRGTGAPAAGWPLGLVLLIVLRRRRC